MQQKEVHGKTWGRKLAKAEGSGLHSSLKVIKMCITTIVHNYNSAKF